MIVVAAIVDGPITRPAEGAALAGAAPDLTRWSAGSGVGATLRFEGIVRATEPDPMNSGEARALLALEYQTYDPMAQREMESLARSVGERYGLRSIVVLHARGRVGVGEVSFVLEVAAARRAAALATVAEFIDGLKQDVPIWKCPVWALAGSR